MAHWLDAMPHPEAAVEIAAGYVSAASPGGGRITPDALATEPLPGGAVIPSPVEPNVADPEALRAALGRLLQRRPIRPQSIALLLPDEAVRVFLLHFETFPRDAEEAVPLLRWRLKKSVPFDVEETAVSYMAQPSREQGVEILAAIARQRIIRQYEEIVEAAGLAPGVVLGSTLAVLPLLEEEQPALLVRMTGETLTTAIVRGEAICVYRCTSLQSDAQRLAPQLLLDEVFPAVAYFQDTWKENVHHARLAGFAGRTGELCRVLESGLGSSVSPLAAGNRAQGMTPGAARAGLDGQFDALIGWSANRGA